MTSPILLTGGTGTLGRLVLPKLKDAGFKVRVLSRKTHAPEDGVEFVTGDLVTGEGLDEAVDGVGTVLHLAGTAKGDGDKAETLTRSARRAGARHIVLISVVGADRIPVVSRVDRAMFGYFESKLAAERVVADSGLPWTTLRASQFYDLALTVVRQLSRMPVVLVPSGVRFQPVDTGEVATRLVELTLGSPSGLVPDIAGPRIYGMDQLVRSYLRATHKRRLIMPVRLGGMAYRAVREGAILAPDRAVGHRTWEDFLAARVGTLQ